MMNNRMGIIGVVTVIISIFMGMSLYESNESEKAEPESQELHNIMRLLMLDIHTINEGIYTQNFDLIETGAANINQHAPLSDQSRQLVMDTLGERMAQFGEFDDVVHSYADSIRDAAIEKNMGRVLEQYRIVEQGCVSCHAAFQNEIRQARIQ
ncbi:hypothetical protein [Rhodohalobacter halophilus]|uniref:hypothetical protein n=1 Tax=Rhodohalobacter halophilus TaxID=1812810 RepID=UPI00083F69E5|nr:hypothetical protein [Rhodohalobacter halophilus]